ncbi:MAG: hypothetical protein ACLQDQ_13285 [Myxococcaceae bacterium]
MKKSLMGLSEMMLFAALGFTGPAYAGGGNKQFTTFDPPDSVYTNPEGINDRGEIAGWYGATNGALRSFLRAPDGTFTTFEVPGDYNYTLVAGLNQEGAVSGDFCDITTTCHGFVRAPDGTLTTFDVKGAGTVPPDEVPGAYPGTFPWNINLWGETYGFTQDNNNVFHGFIRAPDGNITTFDIKGAGTEPFQGTATPFFAGNLYTPIFAAINAFGVVTGTFGDADYVSHGFVRAPGGEITTFDVTGAASTGAYSINLGGEIIGTYTDSAGAYHGFLRRSGGEITTFDVKGASSTLPSTNNLWGAIVGEYFDASGVFHGFLRSADGSITTFDVPDAASTAGIANNNLGAITGLYWDVNGVQHGFLMQP